MKKTVFIFGSLILALLLFLKISSYTLVNGHTRTELVLISVAVIFFFIGGYLNKKSLQKKRNITRDQPG
jgi:lipopolysaccharide export LptBFGC system permease protein LptF